MGRGLRLGSIAGIDIVVDPSLLVIFLLILFMLGMDVFPAWHPQWGVGLTWVTAAAAAVLALEALAILGRRDLGQLPIVQGNKLLGLVRREDVLKWLSIHAAPAAAKANS